MAHTDADPAEPETQQAATPEALKNLIEAHFERVRAYVRLRVSERDCEDVAADIFLRAVERIRQVSGDPAAWLYAIARSRIADHYRDKGRAMQAGLLSTPTSELPDQKADCRSLNPLAALEAGEFRALLHEKLEQLSELERDVIAFKFSDGLSNIQIADMLKLTPVNLGVILHRALRKLRDGMLAAG